MSNKLIRTLYEQRLAAWAATKPLPVAWQNVPFTAPAGTYLEAFLLPADTDSLDVAGDHRVYTGVFQVSIVAPKGQGSEPAETLGEEIAALFPNNLLLSSGTFAVQSISPCSIGPAIQGGTHYTVPAWFRYRADTI